MNDIHTRAAQLVRDSHGEMTMTEAYQELSRRAHQARRYGRTRVAPQKHLQAVESPKRRLWYQDTDT